MTCQLNSLKGGLDRCGNPLPVGSACCWHPGYAEGRKLPVMHSLALSALVDERLDAARASPSGRRARTVHGGHEHALRPTLIALVAGAALGDHSSPGEATLQVMHGRVRLVTATESQEAVAATSSSSRRNGTVWPRSMTPRSCC